MHKLKLILSIFLFFIMGNCCEASGASWSIQEKNTELKSGDQEDEQVLDESESKAELTSLSFNFLWYVLYKFNVKEMVDAPKVEDTEEQINQEYVERILQQTGEKTIELFRKNLEYLNIPQN